MRRLGKITNCPTTDIMNPVPPVALPILLKEMFMLERRAESIDVLERVLYNAIPHGMALSGTNSYYQNPLSDRDHLRDNCWVCCPPNLSRTLLQIGRYAFSHTDRELYVNLFVGGSSKTRLAQGTVTLNVATDYPWKGDVKITVLPEKPARFAVLVRQPGWCSKAILKVNGESISTSNIMDRGYLRLDREWHENDQIELILDMPVQRMVAHPNIRDCQGKVTLQRGPVVYGFEGLDNNNDPRIILGNEPRFQVEHRSEMLGGITVIKGVTAEGRPFIAIPFYALANRDKSSQEVWIAQQNLKTDSSWWTGRLYRTFEDVAIKK